MAIHKRKTESTAARQSSTDATYSLFTRRVLIAAGIVTVIVLGLLFLWFIADVLLLIFAGILLAVFLRGLSEWVSKYARLSSGLSLAVVVLVLLGVIGLGVWLLAPEVADQFDQLVQSLPNSAQQVRQRIMQYTWGRRLLEQMPPPTELISGRANVFARATGIFSTTFNAISNLIIILFIGLYLATDPSLYEKGIVRLVPIRKRERMREVLHQLGYTLRWWIVGQLSSMTIVGVLSTVGLWLLGEPLALSLGLLAGLMEFIPNLGPILAAMPAVLLALTQSPTLALYVALLYVAIQATESYLITPLVLKQAVSLPPALTITAIVVAGVLFGFLGLLLAAPLTAAMIVLVKMLYIEDTLGDTANLPSE